MEEWLREQPEVKTVSMTLGSTPPRYYPAPAAAFRRRPNFGNVLVELHDKRQTESVEARFNAWVTANLPDVWLRSSLFKLSPVPDAAIEFGFIGENADTLRRLHGRRRGGDVAHAGGGEHPQRLGQPRADVAAGLLADEGPAHRHHPQPDGPGHHHRHAGVRAGRIPRGRPVHADPVERREHRLLQPHQLAGPADLQPFGQGVFDRAGHRRLPLRLPAGRHQALQPPAGDEGAVRSRPRGQHHAAVRRAARLDRPRRGASRGLFDEGLRRAGEPAGVQRGAGPNTCR